MSTALLLAMSSFALAASVSPGPVNAVALAAGVHHGFRRSLAFVTGATGPADHLAPSRAADFISANCTLPLRLEDVAAASGLSPSSLVRAFMARCGLTPHAYQVNRRIQFGQDELRRGRPIVDVALLAGFADQAHFRRAFKRHLAATPGQCVGPGAEARA